MRYIVSVIALMLGLSMQAQQKFTNHLTEPQKDGEGQVVLVQDAEIEALVNGPNNSSNLSNATSGRRGVDSTRVLRKKINIPVGKRVRLRGYRIQVYAGGNTRQGKLEAQRAEHSVHSHFPEMAVYTSFMSPRWVCRVGDFTTIEDAQKMLKQLRQVGGFREASIVKSTIMHSN